MAKTLEDYQLEEKVRASIPESVQLNWVEECVHLVGKLYRLTVISACGVRHGYLAYDLGTRFELHPALER